MRLSRPLVCLAFVALFLGGVAKRSSPKAAVAPTTNRPNIVLLLADDLDVELGSVGAMPYLSQRFAPRGATLTRAFVSTPLCCPSRSTLLTGKYTHHHEVFRNRGELGGYRRFRRLGLERATVAVALEAAGYSTALFGKYLNEYSGSHVPPGWSRWVAVAGGSAYNGFGYRLNVDGQSEPHRAANEDYATDVLVEHALRFIEQEAARGAPFFVVLSVLAPHPPAAPAPRHAKLFLHEPLPRSGSFDEVDVRDKPRFVRNRPRVSAQSLDAMTGLHRNRLASLQAVDEALRRIAETIGDLGLADATYVFFSSDNGFHLGQHRLGAGKGTLYEEDVHIPLFATGPDIPAGLEIGELTTTADLSATFRELAGLPAGGDGRSIAGFLRADPPPSWREFALLEHFTPADGGSGEEAAGPAVPLYTGLRAPDFKYVRHWRNEEHELYVYPDDSHELDNRARCLTRSDREALRLLLEALGRCRGDECRSLEETDALPDLAGRLATCAQ